MLKNLEEAGDICPNCGQHTGGDSTCSNCGAILESDDELEGFHEEEDDIDKDLDDDL